LITELIRTHESSCNTFLDAILEVELTPFTQNFHYMESSTEKWLAKYKDARSGRTAERQNQQQTKPPEMVGSTPAPAFGNSVPFTPFPPTVPNLGGFSKTPAQPTPTKDGPAFGGNAKTPIWDQKKPENIANKKASFAFTAPPSSSGGFGVGSTWPTAVSYFSQC
jgi:hypothetical protein